MLFNFDLGVFLQDSLSGLFVAGLTAGFGYFFINRYISKLNFSSKMQSYGFINTSTSKISKREIKEICTKACKVKMIYVSGFHFFNNYSDLINSALNNNIEVSLLTAKPNCDFLKDIERMEYNTKIEGKRLREKDSTITSEIEQLIEKYSNSNLNMRFYNTEYRLPYIIAYYPNGDIKAWLTMTLPPYKSTKSFVLRGKKNTKIENDEDANFIDMMECNFDTIWEHSSFSLDDIKKENTR